MSQGHPEDKEKTKRIEQEKKEHKERVEEEKRKADYPQQPKESLDTSNPPKGGSGVWSKE